MPANPPFSQKEIPMSKIVSSLIMLAFIFLFVLGLAAASGA